MKLLILLLIIGGLVVFSIQNLEPVALVFFGSAVTFSLPVAAWILIFGLAGMLTSLLIQFLNYLQSKSTPRASAYKSYAPQEPEPYSPSPKVREPETRGQASTDTTAVSEWESQPTDWEGTSKASEEWNIEEPPPRSTVLRDFKRRLREEEPQDVEPPEPKPPQPSSVYSYGYRGAEDTGVRSKIDEQNDSTDEDRTKPVYDANYRIITPPYRKKSDRPLEDAEDEEWI